jgi:hypothetical protein
MHRVVGVSPQNHASDAHLRLDGALLAGADALDALVDMEPVDRRDAVLALLAIHDLHTAPIERLGDGVQWQHHPPLERSVLGSLLATNRQLQPQMIGVLDLIELQAGPRCRKVVKALKRLDVPADAFPFYDEHPVGDPRRGKDWVAQGWPPLGDDSTWAAGITRGTRWRCSSTGASDAMADRFAPAWQSERKAS